MAETIKKIKGMAVICGYDCDIYRNLFKDWYSVKKEALADGARARIETLWINQTAAAKLNKKLF
jgi:DNA adenine methylase